MDLHYQISLKYVELFQRWNMWPDDIPMLSSFYLLEQRCIKKPSACM